MLCVCVCVESASGPVIGHGSVIAVFLAISFSFTYPHSMHTQSHTRSRTCKGARPLLLHFSDKEDMPVALQQPRRDDSDAATAVCWPTNDYHYSVRYLVAKAASIIDWWSGHTHTTHNKPLIGHKLSGLVNIVSVFIRPVGVVVRNMEVYVWLLWKDLYNGLSQTIAENINTKSSVFWYHQRHTFSRDYNLCKRRRRDREGRC